MSRSLKKGPYISVKLDKKVAAMEASILYFYLQRHHVAIQEQT